MSQASRALMATYKPVETGEDDLEAASNLSTIEEDGFPGCESLGNDRKRRNSTSERMRSGSVTNFGNFWRLRTRSDVQEAVLWLEGEQCQNQDIPPTSKTTPKGAQSPRGGNPHIDADPCLPLCYFCIILTYGCCLLVIHQKCVHNLAGPSAANAFVAVMLLVFIPTVVAMFTTAFMDPGQLPADVDMLPSRAHRNFQYARPLMRYDHFCRWVGNGIALHNHRFFVVMLVGLTFMVSFGLIAGIILIFSPAEPTLRVLIAIHVVYSCGMAYYVLPVFRLHMQFIWRNELAQEWKSDKYYVAFDESGQVMPVAELNDSHYDQGFDNFEYCPDLNPYDAGCAANCYTFWCAPRSGPSMGQF